MIRQDLELKSVSNETVLGEFKALCRTEREQQAKFLAYLNTIEERKLFALEGYSSLFRYLVEHFHYSEASALKRIQVARLSRRFPKVYSLLAEGGVSLSALERIAPHLTQENALT